MILDDASVIVNSDVFVGERGHGDDALMMTKVEEEATEVLEDTPLRLLGYFGRVGRLLGNVASKGHRYVAYSSDVGEGRWERRRGWARGATKEGLCELRVRCAECLVVPLCSV